MLKINTSNASGLLKAIKDAIDAKKVETWSYDKDGDFTHEVSQWKNKAWLRPEIENFNNVLKFRLIPPENTTITKEVNGVFHGRFIEMLFAHFDSKFSGAIASV